MTEIDFRRGAMTELDRLLERNRRANDLKRGLDRGIDHDELLDLVERYRALARAEWFVKQP